MTHNIQTILNKIYDETSFEKNFSQLSDEITKPLHNELSFNELKEVIKNINESIAYTKQYCSYSYKYFIPILMFVEAHLDFMKQS